MAAAGGARECESPEEPIPNAPQSAGQEGDKECQWVGYKAQPCCQPPAHLQPGEEGGSWPRAGHPLFVPATYSPVASGVTPWGQSPPSAGEPQSCSKAWRAGLKPTHSNTGPLGQWGHKSRASPEQFLPAKCPQDPSPWVSVAPRQAAGAI